MSQSQAVKHLGWVSFVIWMLAKNETLRITLNANQMTPLLNDELSFSIYRSAYTMYVIHAELSMSLQLYWLERANAFCISSRHFPCVTFLMRLGRWYPLQSLKRKNIIFKLTKVIEPLVSKKEGDKTRPFSILFQFRQEHEIFHIFQLFMPMTGFYSIAIGIFETNMRNNAHKNKTRILSKSKLYSWLEMG